MIAAPVKVTATCTVPYRIEIAVPAMTCELVDPAAGAGAGGGAAGAAVVGFAAGFGTGFWVAVGEAA
ncbi:hypothetical protein, partial [Cellulomonas citrea]|uniref:hypothetical protein n=1 Tax=Cellulomonas citrea TaxID=1909423 RepID=UPI0019163376